MKLPLPLLHARRQDPLYSAVTSARPLPLNFDPADRKLFAHELHKSIPPTLLLHFENCRVASNGLLFKGIHVFEESFGYRSMLEQWATLKNVSKFFVANYAIKKKQRFDEEVVLFVDNWSGAYFHWLTDALPRLYAVRETLPSLNILLPEECASQEYTLPSLMPFKLKAIRYLNKNSVLLCRKLLVPTHTAPSGNYNPNIVKGLRDLFRGHFRGQEELTFGDKIYISRKKAKVRRIVNEAEVDETLRAYGFESVCFEDFSFAQQVSIASNARCVVSNHGAGLTNILFMPAGCSVLELRKSGDSHNNCYFALASSLDQRYFYQLCDACNPNEGAYSADLLVRTDALQKNLDRMSSE